MTVTILTDNYPGETTWSLTDASGAVVAAGGPYATAAVEEVTQVCVAPGCYTFTINDSFGDGICCLTVTGLYTVSSQGTVLATGGVRTQRAPSSVWGGLHRRDGVQL